MIRYPFSPEALDEMPEELTKLYRSLEYALLEEIASRLRLGGKLNEVTVQDIRALRSHGIPLDEITKAISKTAGISQQKLDALLADVVAENQQYYKEVIDLAQVTAPETLVDAAVVDGIIRQTADELRNITRSMGFLVDAGRTMLPPAKAYQWALDNALLQVESGAISYTEAIRNATRQLADSGLQWVNYESGARSRVDVAVRRAVMTGVNQINRQYDAQAMEALQTDLVETSAHAGARNTGIGYQNHEGWQGKVYRWRKYTRQFPDASKGNYGDFDIECAPDDVQGICGANCRHSYHAFVEGVMEPTYSAADLEAMRGTATTYEGKTYSTYEATQFQRRMEASVRHWKRREAAAVTDVDKMTARARIRRLNTKYREFSEAAGLRTQKERMKVYTQKTA